MRTLALITASAILLLQILAVHALAGRPLHYDENEYLHASWLMAAGKRIYRDFFEDHPPHFAVMLQALLPAGDLRAIDVRVWAMRARLVSGVLGTLAAGAVALLAWRMTRAPAAPIVAAATLLASPQIWSRGLADIRAEAPTLALFWWGVVLLTWSSESSRAQAVRAGAGIGLMFLAALANPKWPLECVVMGAYYVAYVWRSRRIAAVAAAVPLAALALAPLFTITNVRDYVFFNVRLKSEVVGDFTSNPWITRFFAEVPLWSTASPQHRWWWIVAAMVVAAAGMRVRKLAEPRLAWIALALAAAALVELRFVYPYPYLWAQYLVMVAATAALVYAVLTALLPQRVQLVVVIAAAALAIVPLWRKAFTDVPPSWARYWSMQRALQTSLRPGETVWISPPRHPVAAFDASYYWYNFRESAPSAMKLRAQYPQFLPSTGPEELPPCHLRARYIELGDWTPFLGRVCACAERAFNAGRLSPTPYLGIFETGAAPRDEPWLRRTRGLWSDLCRRQEIFLRGGQLKITP